MALDWRLPKWNEAGLFTTYVTELFCAADEAVHAAMPPPATLVPLMNFKYNDVELGPEPLWVEARAVMAAAGLKAAVRIAIKRDAVRADAAGQTSSRESADTRAEAARAECARLAKENTALRKQLALYVEGRVRRLSF